MERSLTPWERAVIEQLVDVEHSLGARVRASLDHLVATGFCGCGCPSVYLRDGRFPASALELNDFSVGVCDSPEWSARLNVDDAARPSHLDVELWVGQKPDPAIDLYDASERPDLPDPQMLRVTALAVPPWLEESTSGG